MNREQLTEVLRPVAAVLLAVAVVVGSAFLWIGVPVAGLWIAGKVTTTTTGFLFAVLGGIPLGMIAFGLLLLRINALYEQVSGADRPQQSRSAWLTASTEERRKVRAGRGPRRLIDVAMTASAVAALVLMVVWFFFFAHMQLAPMQ